MTIAVGFLHSTLLLWTLPLALVPIIIHLLNRRRYRTVRWAAMDHLLAALKRNRRRLRMEQWLLLAARVLIVLLLVFFVSRPQISGSILGEVRTHHVVCLDDSASMAHRRGATDAFRTALQNVERLVEELAERRARGLLTILRSSAAPAPDLAAMNLGPKVVVQVRDVLGQARISQQVADLEGMLEQARLRIEASPEASRAEIYLVTDLRRVDWLTDAGEIAPGVLRELAALDPEHHRVNVISVSGEDTENLAIVDLQRRGRVAPTGLPLQIVAEVSNTGSTPSAPVELAFEIDGQSRVLRAVGGLQPGESAEIAIAHTFSTPGSHGVEASLPRDRYLTDDQRALALDVVEASRALLVDGDPGGAPEEAETYFLEAALQHSQSGISVEVIPDHALANRDLSQFDVVYLCNVAAPDEATVQELEHFVGAGGGLVIFLGNQVDPAKYDEALYRDGTGLLPRALTDLDGDLDRPERVFVADATHGTMRTATENLELMFSRLVLVGRWIGVAENPAKPAKVVLRARDAGGPPLMLSHHREGGGEVVLVTTTADTHWTNWPRWPAFLIVTQEMHRLVAKASSDDAYNLEPSRSLELAMDPGLYRLDVVVRALAEGSLEQTFTAQLAGEGTEIEAKVAVPMRELVELGLFELRMTPHSGASERRLFSRNAPPLESRLARVTGRELRRALPDGLQDRLNVIEQETASATATAGYGEMWRPLAIAMLLLMIVESVMGWRFGRR